MKSNGFTLTELLVVIVVLAVLVAISSIPLLGFLAKNKLKHNTIVVEQMLKEAQGYAKSKSTKISVVFSTNDLEIQTQSGSVINDYDFEENIIYDANSSGISSNTVIFDFKGSPVSTTDAEPSDFTRTDGKIVLCYTSKNSTTCRDSKTIYVTPLTGAIVED